MSVLVMKNDGPAILETNYWDSEQAAAGKFLVSLNAGAFRLLVPDMHAGLLDDLATAKTCVVSRGPWPAARLHDAFEILFDDGTPDPFALHLSPESFDRLPAAEDVGKVRTLSVWVRSPSGKPVRATERPCLYRLSRSLPDLRPWGQGA